MNYIKQNKKAFIILLGGILSSLIIFLAPNKAESISGLSYSFSGTISEVDYETCCTGVIVTVEAGEGSPTNSGGDYFLSWWEWAFVVKHNYNLSQESIILGKGTGIPMICMTWDGECYEDYEIIDRTFYSSLGDQVGLTNSE